MFLRKFISNVLSSQGWKIITIIGGIGGLKYGTDVIVDAVANHHKLMERKKK